MTEDGSASNHTPSAKQLVFLFMAATVVAVVVFLCGVLVGRGVPPSRAADAFAADAPDPGAAPDTLAAPGSTGPGPRADDLTYFRRLESREPVPEVIPPAAPLVEEPPAPATVPLPAVATASPETTSMEAEAPAGPDDGFTVQVAALRGRREADEITQHLVAKGYDAYVVEPTPGAPAAVYRVRVGRALSRQDAEDMLRRLEIQEQFKPWITR